MMNKYSFLLASLVLFSVPAVLHTQPDLVSRTATYNGGGLVSMSAEQVDENITGTSNYSNPQKNMVRHGGVYYHVFAATDGDADIYLRTSIDGLTWTAPVQVNDDSLDATQSIANVVVYDDAGNTIVVVCWDDRRATSAQLRVATSMDGGATFAPSVAVSSHTDAQYTIGNIAIDDAGRLYAAWSRFDGGCMGTAWFSTSDDDGFDWTAMTSIFSGGCFSGNHCHVIASGPDSVMVAISDDQFNHTNVIVLHSTDGGTSFTQTSVTTYTLFQSITAFMSSTVDASGRVHFVFNYGETQGTVTNIHYTTSTDWGQTWSAPVAVNDQTDLFSPWAYQSAQMPAIGVGPSTGNIYITWGDQRAGSGNNDVYLSRSTDGGVTWDADQMVNLVSAPLDQGWASMALQDLGGGNESVAITWNDNRFAVGVPEIPVTATGRIYPIPASDRITVEPPADLSGMIRYEMIDARGSLVLQGTWNNNSQQIIDVSGLQAGIQVLRLVSMGRVVTMPWIKE